MASSWCNIYVPGLFAASLTLHYPTNLVSDKLAKDIKDMDMVSVRVMVMV